MPGSVQNAECPSGVKALQRCTERLPHLPANRVALLALAGEGVVAARSRRVAPAQEGAEGRNCWALRREARPIAVRGRPGDGEVVHFPAQGKIALPLVRTVRGHDIHEGPADALPQRWRDLPVGEGIAKQDHVVQRDPLTDRLRHGQKRVAVRDLAMLDDLPQTHQHQRTRTECRQGGGHLPSVQDTEPFREAHRRMRGRCAVLQGELQCGAPHERDPRLDRAWESLAALGLEERTGERQPWGGVRKAPVGDEHHVQGCRLTQRRHKREGVQRLARRDKGAVAIHPDAYGPSGSGGAEARLDILDDVLPWLILAHDADGERGRCLGKGDGAPGGLLVPSNRPRRARRPRTTREGQA